MLGKGIIPYPPIKIREDKPNGNFTFNTHFVFDFPSVRYVPAQLVSEQIPQIGTRGSRRSVAVQSTKRVGGRL